MSTPHHASKAAQILHACHEENKKELCALATSSNGFVEDHIRRVACKHYPNLLRMPEPTSNLTSGPVLLGTEAEDYKGTRWQDLPVHRDEDQVRLDVHRAFVYYPTGMSY